MTRDMLWNGINPLIIAEVGINHNGDLNIALEMIEVAKNAGADVVKFQTFKASEMVAGDSTYTYETGGQIVTETQLKMFSRYEFRDDAWKILKSKCDEVGVIFMSTPQNISDLDLLESLGITAIKVGSDDLVNTPMLENFASRGLPLIFSIGMGFAEEVERALNSLGWPQKPDLAALVCTSQYPTPVNYANLKRIQTLKSKYPGLTVGFSDHTIGNHAAIVARTLGAQIFEKHFTLDNEMIGPDHSFSPNPEDLKSWVEAIRSTDVILGTGELEPDEFEIDMRNLAHRSIHSAVAISKGQIITEDMIAMLRPNTGLAPHRVGEILGHRSNKDIMVGEPIQLSYVDLS